MLSSCSLPSGSVASCKAVRRNTEYTILQHYYAIYTFPFISVKCVAVRLVKSLQFDWLAKSAALRTWSGKAVRNCKTDAFVFCHPSY